LITEIEMDRTLSIASNILEFAFYIINFNEYIALETTEWFTPSSCHMPLLTVVNKYIKDSRKWKEPLVYYEKFLNFYGCELILALPEYDKSGDSTIWSYAKVSNDSKSFSLGGFVPAIFQIASKKCNFIDGYQPYQQNNKTSLSIHLNFEEAALISINQTYKLPNVIIEVFDMVRFATAEEVRNTLPFMQFRDYFLVTPGKAYTAYEKLLLPFDTLTWILLAVTFSIAVFSIFTINRLSREIRDVIYGVKVKTPIINLLSIFFGIAQTRLPDGNFSRQILILFIYFCLIFRTCFQSKIFEFMTSTPRRPPPKTIQDLVDRNYIIAAIDYKGFREFIEHEKDKWY